MAKVVSVTLPKDILCRGPSTIKVYSMGRNVNQTYTKMKTTKL